MKEKKEDDEGRPKSTNESMRLNPFADFPNHEELEQQAKLFQVSVDASEGRDVLDEVYYPTDCWN